MSLNLINEQLLFLIKIHTLAVKDLDPKDIERVTFYLASFSTNSISSYSKFSKTNYFSVSLTFDYVPSIFLKGLTS